MNKNLYIVVGLVILVLIGGGAYMMMNKSTPSSPYGIVPEEKPVITGTTSKSLKDLLASGIAQKCTYKYKNENTDMEGTSYISSGRMRGVFNSTINGKIMTTHMIVEGKTSYLWTDDQNTGFKMSFDPETTETDTGATQPGSVDINKTFDYNCSPWRGDNSMFVPPTSMKFTDYSSIMGPSSGAKISTQQVNPGCSACDSLEGDSKTQCRTALKCS